MHELKFVLVILALFAIQIDVGSSSPTFSDSYMNEVRISNSTFNRDVRRGGPDCLNYPGKGKIGNSCSDNGKCCSGTCETHMCLCNRRTRNCYYDDDCCSGWKCGKSNLCYTFEEGGGTGGGIQIKHKINDLCIDLRGGNMLNGTIVNLWGCSKANNQRLDPDTTVDSHGESLMTLIFRHSGKCMESNGQTEAVDQWNCDGGYNQKWVFYPQSNTKYYRLQNRTTQKCLHIEDSTPKQGSVITQKTCAFLDTPEFEKQLFYSILY